MSINPIQAVPARQYKGMRYVPIFDGDWDITKDYDPLVIVSYQGNSYTSRTFVPHDTAITDETYWALTGNYNAQVEAYRQEVSLLSDEVDTLINKIDYVTPEDYGAIGDGIADDSEALQRAFDSGKNVYIPSNTYLLDSTVTINNDIYVFGNGLKSCLKITGKITTDTVKHKIVFTNFKILISKNNGHGVEIIAENNALADHTVKITNMYFEFNNELNSSTASMLYLYGVRESIISKCIFYGSTYSYAENVKAIECKGDSTHLTMNNNISECEFYYVGTGVYLNNSDEADVIYLAGFRINNNTIIGCKDGVRTMFADAPFVDNNMIDYCINPIYAEGTTNIRICNNYIQSPDGNGCVHIKYGSNSAIDNIYISGNNIHSANGTTSGSETTDAIILEGNDSPQILRHIILSDNTIFRVKSAFNMKHCQFVNVNNNQVFYAKNFINGNNNAAYVNILNNYIQTDVTSFVENVTNTFKYSNNQWGARYTSKTLTGEIDFSVEANSSESYQVTFTDTVFMTYPAISVEFSDVGSTWSNVFIAITSVTTTGFTVKVVNNDSSTHANVIKWSAIVS